MYYNSYRMLDLSKMPKKVVWQDWNGHIHEATDRETLLRELMEAPLCQTEVKK